MLETTMPISAAKAGSKRLQVQVLANKVSHCLSVLSSDVSNTLNDDTFHAALLSKVNIPHTPLHKKNVISTERLAMAWNIGIKAANQTLHTTMQMGVRTVSNSNTLRRFISNDRQLRY
jgi:hypothetical protein